MTDHDDGHENDAFRRAREDRDRILRDPHWQPPEGTHAEQRSWARDTRTELLKVLGEEAPPPSAADAPAELAGDDIPLDDGAGDDPFGDLVSDKGVDPLESLFPDPDGDGSEP